MQTISQPLPLAGPKNVRELGGYATQNGVRTRTHSLLRGDALQNLTDDDCQYLLEYGVRCIIDLRSVDEIERAPDRNLGGAVDTVIVPLQDPVRVRRYSGEFAPSMWELYCWMLEDCCDEFRSVFETIARYPDDCVLFHCSGGKDRTGMVAMLLLELAGVEDETIMADYALSEMVMRELFVLQTAQMESRGLEVPHYIMQSPPENMRRALAHLRALHGSTEQFLRSVGLSNDCLHTILRKLGFKG